ncbi:MAG: hypothetical protein NC394_10515 [Bacteroides sp.]|nr:hypothetical protein [Bacteroides sp.]
MTIDLERVRFYLALSRELRTVSGEYDGIRLLWLDQAAAQLRFNPCHDPKNGRFTSGSTRKSIFKSIDKHGIIEL